MFKKYLLIICIGYLIFVVATSFVLLQKVAFLLFGNEWWKYMVDTFQAVGSFATACTLIWIIYDRNHTKKEKALEEKDAKLSGLMREIMELCDTKKMHENIKISFLIYRLEKEFFEDVRLIQLDNRISPLCAHINQMTKNLTAEYLIGIDGITKEFPGEIYNSSFVDEITMPIFKRRVIEVAFLISKSKRFSVLKLGELNVIQFKTNVEINMLNKLIILAQPICVNYLERTADICWSQQELKDICFIVKGLDVAAYIYVLNHDNGKALVKEFDREMVNAPPTNLTPMNQ